MRHAALLRYRTIWLHRLRSIDSRINGLIRPGFMLKSAVGPSKPQPFRHTVLKEYGYQKDDGNQHYADGHCTIEESCPSCRFPGPVDLPFRYIIVDHICCAARRPLLTQGQPYGVMLMSFK